MNVASFLASVNDLILYVHLLAHGRTLMYVNDMVITGNDPKYIAFVNAHPSE